MHTHDSVCACLQLTSGGDDDWDTLGEMFSGGGEKKKEAPPPPSAVPPPAAADKKNRAANGKNGGAAAVPPVWQREGGGKVMCGMHCSSSRRQRTRMQLHGRTETRPCHSHNHISLLLTTSRLGLVGEGVGVYGGCFRTHPHHSHPRIPSTCSRWSSIVSTEATMMSTMSGGRVNLL